LKIAVLSDIHGNKIALETVINEISVEKIDHIIILGDLVTDLPHETNSVLELIKTLGNFVIKGNRESYLLNDHEPLEYDQFLTTFLTKKIISEKNYNYLELLPEHISLVFDSKFSLHCVHGSPSSNSEHIKENGIEANINHLNKINENLLLCGHTHEQWYKNINGKIILNPGSVGLNFSGDRTANYAIINSFKNKINIELRKTHYDFNQFKKGCDLEIPWIRLCVKGMEDGIIYTLKFLEEAKLRTIKYPIPNEIWNNLFKEWCDKKIL
jgi:putative phosphoesterase